MELTEEKQENTSIIHLEGEMDYLSCDELKKKIEKVIAERVNRLVLDFQNVSYIDSTGIGVLISTRAKAKKGDVELRLAGIQPTVMRVIQLCRLESLYNIDSTLEASLQA